MRIAMLVLAGCSFIVMRGPSPVRGAGPVECTEESAPLVLDGAGALGSTLAAAVFAPVVWGNTDPLVPKEPFVFIAAMSAATAATLWASLLYGQAQFEKCHRAKAEQSALLAAQRLDGQQDERDAADRRVHRDSAILLTKSAEKLARLGDCQLVLVRDAQVRHLDIEFHDAVFVHDAAIARCLAAGN
jgi:hypothetical protein